MNRRSDDDGVNAGCGGAVSPKVLLARGAQCTSRLRRSKPLATHCGGQGESFRWHRDVGPPGLCLRRGSVAYDYARMRLTIELEQEADGRWIAEVPELSGVLAYGDTQDKAAQLARALAFRVLADQLEAGEIEAHSVNSVSFAA